MLRQSGVLATLLVAAAAAVFTAVALASPHDGLVLGTLSGPIPALTLVLEITPLAAPFCAILAALGIAVAIWSMRRGRPIDALLIAAFAAAMLLVLLARSIALFFIAWEAMSLVAAFLVAAHHERREVRRATFTYLIVAQSGALCVLAALALLGWQAGDSSFAAIARNAAHLSPAVRDTVFLLALLGFGSKAGLLPLHFWLPRAHPVAPANASAMLSGAMLEVSLYGLCFVMFVLAAPATIGWGIALVTLGTISAVGGVL